MKKLEYFSQLCARRYRRLFSIHEIEEGSIVQWMFGAVLFYFFVSFSRWIGESTITIETAREGGAICWAYFQNCADFYFLHLIPYGYSQSTLYMVFYGIMLLTVYLMWKKDWVQAHVLLFALFLWKVFVIFFLTSVISGPYDYYHLILTAILLFVPFKEYFLKLGFVFMYFMSATIKFSPGWVLGTYFSSMESGVPFVPSWLTLVATNIVIFGQIIECWFLLSRNKILQRIAVVYATFFHLYSGILVFYNYPSVALPPLLILFGPMYRHTPTPFSKKAIAGWTIIALVGLFQLLGFVVSPNRFLTLEGHRYGMYMFEANHQCLYTIRTYVRGAAENKSWRGLQCSNRSCVTELSTESKNGETVYTRKSESASAWNRCDPYEIWSQARSRCGTPGVLRISMEYVHSINGGPFYKMIDEPSICNLTYRPLAHNEWIKVPPDAPVVGYPVENDYQY
ncbi:MAG: hypothetical protein Athens041674_742 [Parcubacteria group bacterium Athens0416_74]|nr:MAG: hypothetical protein Athens041674_742 [Parcubacteria group bacterium Athens0416_74]